MKRLLIGLIPLIQLVGAVELTQITNSHSSLGVELDQTATPAILIRVSMPDGWYTYGEDPGQVGKPLTLVWTSDDTVVGPLEHPNTVIKKEGIFTVNAIPEQGLWTLPTIEAPGGVKGELTVKYLVCKDICVPQSASIMLDTTATSSDAGRFSVMKALLFAFFGGLILNVMPCVFPILFLKVLSLVKSKDYTKPQRVQAGVGYAAGILMSFMSLALVLWSLKWVGLSIGWGFHLQSAPFVMAMSIVFLGVTLHLCGKLEIPARLLSAFGQAAGKLSANGSRSIFWSNLNTGILATAVATPCTAPLMAPAIAYAFTQPVPILAAIFAALGLGMAAPYLLAVTVPGVAVILPKPGAWMEKAKHILALPMGASLIWMLWVLKQQVSWPIYMAFVIILILFSTWSIGKSSYSRLSKLLLSVLILIAVTTLASGLWLERSKPKSNATETLKQLSTLITSNRPVLVDVTADWCITCKTNEFLVLNTKEMQTFFKTNNITVLTLDWTNYNDEITRYLASFNRNGVPLYVWYKPGQDPKVLPQILTKDSVKAAIKN